ncbi:MAG: hypothetical protein A7315_06930 [Candidatus Altiarchaeales archaeon WOR_SM1_79]|nr:MAG: hypothetical protein A7315_06930 [Candidatus Altiarchaeales archaeon WOR_SM1_79]
MEPAYAKVGSKGELYLPKKIRKKLGFEPNKRIVYRMIKNKLEVEKVPDVVELLKKPKFASVTPDEFEDWSEKWQNEIFGKEREKKKK